MSSPASGLSQVGTAIQQAITDFITGVVGVFDGIAQYFVQNAEVLGYIFATIIVTTIVLKKTGLWDMMINTLKSIF
jgi:phage shock protein PspC (stress-responsive transcriptional regulator)